MEIYSAQELRWRFFGGFSHEKREPFRFCFFCEIRPPQIVSVLHVFLVVLFGRLSSGKFLELFKSHWNFLAEIISIKAPTSFLLMFLFSLFRLRFCFPFGLVSFILPQKMMVIFSQRRTPASANQHHQHKTATIDWAFTIPKWFVGLCGPSL